MVNGIKGFRFLLIFLRVLLTVGFGVARGRVMMSAMEEMRARIEGAKIEDRKWRIEDGKCKTRKRERLLTSSPTKGCGARMEDALVARSALCRDAAIGAG